MKHHVIYLPGLGDQRYIQGLLIQGWWLLGVQPHYHYIGWRDRDESYEAKLHKVLARIDRLHSKGKTISLIGASAGASMAVNAYSERSDVINAVVTVCGKLQRIETVSEEYYQRNPAFRGSLTSLEDTKKSLHSTDLQKILTLRPLTDSTVAPRDALLLGATNEKLPTHGHARTIVLSATRYAPRWITFIKSRSNKTD